MWMLLVMALLQGTVPVRVLDEGPQSHVDDARQVAVRDAAEWDALWRQHAPDRDQPRVDFTREMVVAVFLGSRNTAGFSVKITGAEVEQGGLVVRFHETRPQPGGVVAQVITSPYYVAAVARHSGTVKFERIQ